MWIAALLAVGIGLLAMSSKKGPTMFLPGHRYLVTVTGIDPNSDPSYNQDVLGQILTEQFGPVFIVRAFTIQTNGVATATVDYTGTSPKPVGSAPGASIVDEGYATTH